MITIYLYIPYSTAPNSNKRCHEDDTKSYLPFFGVCRNSLSVKNLTMHNMAFEVFPNSNTWPDIWHHCLELTLTKVSGSSSANLVRSRDIYQGNAHVVTNNTQLPTKRDEGFQLGSCSFHIIKQFNEHLGKQLWPMHYQQIPNRNTLFLKTGMI